MGNHHQPEVHPESPEVQPFGGAKTKKELFGALARWSS